MLEAVRERTGVVDESGLEAIRGEYDAMMRHREGASRLAAGDLDGVKKAILRPHPAIGAAATFAAESGLDGEGFVDLLKFFGIVAPRSPRVALIADQFNAYVRQDAPQQEVRDWRDRVS